MALGRDKGGSAIGIPGSTWRNGVGAPANSLGADGDQYRDTATDDTYSRAGGTYTKTGNIRGAGGKAGVLLAGTALVKGNVYYKYGAAWNLLRVGSHELGYGLIGLVDAAGDLIAPGNVADVTGLGFVDGTDYYIEEPDATGRNLAVLPLPMPASLLPSNGRSYFYVGRAYAVGAKTLLRFNFEASVLNTAASKQTFDVTTLTYGSNTTAAQVRRIFDVQETQSSRLYADGDSGVDASFQGSPVDMTISGAAKKVFLQEKEYTYQKPHSGTPAAWTATQAGDYLLLFACTDGNQGAPGMTFGYQNKDFFTVRFYGTDMSYIAGQHYVIAADNGSVSGPDFFPGHGLTALGPKKLVWMRLNIDGRVMKVRVWAYDTSKPLTTAGIAAQGANEPAAWEVTYTNGSAFPIGDVGWLLDNAEMRIYRMSKSYDPQIPAPFALVP